MQEDEKHGTTDAAREAVEAEKKAALLAKAAELRTVKGLIDVKYNLSMVQGQLGQAVKFMSRVNELVVAAERPLAFTDAELKYVGKLLARCIKGGEKIYEVPASVPDLS